MENEHLQNIQEIIQNKVIEYLETQTIQNHKVENLDFIKTFQYGDIPILCFEVETTNPDNPYWLVFVNGDPKLDMPNAAYNVNLFNHQILKEMDLGVFQATFNYHIGMMISHQKNIENLMNKAKHATKH